VVARFVNLKASTARRDLFLAMFNVYIDDSGTSPTQPVAIASALIVPAKRILALEKEWNGFLDSRRIRCFHTSECVARNSKSVFANWTDEEVRDALERVRQIAKKFPVKALSWSVKKTKRLIMTSLFQVNYGNNGANITTPGPFIMF
jgi:hypothetical protein